MGKNECGDSHKEHLCKLAKEDNYDRVKKLSVKPAFICKKCLRVADCADNLCKAEPF